MTRTTSLAALLFAFLCAPILGQQTDKSLYGTCAVFLQNGSNLAVTVDSAITTNLKGVRLNQHELACKIWHPLPEMIAVTTGLYSTIAMFRTWKAVPSGKFWTESLPPRPTEDQVDMALRGWGKELLDFLAANEKNSNFPKGEIASLTVAFASNEKLYFYKERIISFRGHPIRDDGQSVRWSLSKNRAARLLSGSCRNFIRVGGERAVEVSPSESQALDELFRQSRSIQINSANQLGDLANRFEDLLSNISKAHSSDPNIGDEIGPPFQKAIFSSASNNWTTTFSDPCP